jgi:hypothetical protein
VKIFTLQRGAFDGACFWGWTAPIICWMTSTAQCLPTDVVAVSMTLQIYDV